MALLPRDPENLWTLLRRNGHYHEDFALLCMVADALLAAIGAEPQEHPKEKEDLVRYSVVRDQRFITNEIVEAKFMKARSSFSTAPKTTKALYSVFRSWFTLASSELLAPQLCDPGMPYAGQIFRRRAVMQTRYPELELSHRYIRLFIDVTAPMDTVVSELAPILDSVLLERGLMRPKRTRKTTHDLEEEEEAWSRRLAVLQDAEDHEGVDRGSVAQWGRMKHLFPALCRRITSEAANAKNSKDLARINKQGPARIRREKKSAVDAIFRIYYRQLPFTPAEARALIADFQTQPGSSTP